jgi:hypothetical protein
MSEEDQVERTSKEDIRELRRQQEDRMVALGFTAEQREILFSMEQRMATWLINNLTIRDSRADKLNRYRAEVILEREPLAASFSLEDRMQLSEELRPRLRKAFIRLFAADEAGMQKARMSPQMRASYMTEKERKVLWPK